MTRYTVALISIVFFIIAGSGTYIYSEILGDYLGYTACVECHPDIVEKWKATKHADAFENLKTQGVEKQDNPGCFRCHVVAYNEDGGYIDMELTPELKDVQCEACHGPGLTHTETLSADDLKKANEEVCRQCHTEGQDKDFDFVKKSALVH